MTMPSPAPAGLSGASPNHDAFWLEARRADGSALSLPIQSVPGGRAIQAPNDCEVSVIEKYESLRADPYTTQSKLYLTLGERSKASHFKLVHEGRQSTHHSFMEVEVRQGASFQSRVFLFGGAEIHNTLHVRMTGEDAECSLNGLYVGSGQQVIETHTLIDHQKPRGLSREVYKGILDDQARGLFDGLIIVQKDAQKADSAQTSKNLLLSAQARANANPELKIYANDVKCKHGATIGQISADQMFYLRSRGIPAPEARRLLVYGFASEMIQDVEVPSLRDILFPCLNLATSIKK